MDWPLTCPREEATIEDRLDNYAPGRSKLLYRYEKKNLHSGEEFTVFLHSWRDDFGGVEYPDKVIISLQQ